MVRSPEAGSPAPGAVIEVGDANVEALIMMRRRYEEEGISISPIFDEYVRTSADPIGAERVVFLRPCHPLGETMLCYTVDGAVEATTQLPQIRALLAPAPSTEP